MIRRVLVVALAVLAPAALGACPEKQSAEQASSALANATSVRVQELVRQLASKDYATVEASFAPALKASLPPDALAALWEGAEQQYGAFVSQGATVATLNAGAVDYREPLTFSNGSAELRVTYDHVGPSGLVTALSISAPGGP